MNCPYKIFNKIMQRLMSSIIVSSACTLTLTYNNLSFPLGLDIVIPEEAPHLSFPQRPPICHSRRGPPFVIPEGFYRESSVFAFAIAVFRFFHVYQPFSVFQNPIRSGITWRARMGGTRLMTPHHTKE